MLFRALIWLLLGYILWQAVKKLYQQIQKTQQQATTRRSLQSIPMVRCQRCGLHIPKQEALNVDNRYYCCEAHKQAHLEEGSGQHH